MKAGRYTLNGKSGLFLAGNDHQLFDWSVLDTPATPQPVREAISNTIKDPSDASFCASLPKIEEFLEHNGESLQKAAPLASSVKFLPPVQPRTFICVGLNYRDHAQESAMELPKVPLLFAKT